MKKSFLLKKSLLVTGIVLCILAFVISALGEEGSAVHDFSGDLSGYARAVAQLNSSGSLPGTVSIKKTGRKTEQLHAVLCRTDGSELSYDGEVRYILAGPRNCYTLFFASEEAAGQAAEALRQDKSIRYAECDSVVRAASGGANSSFHSSGAERMHFSEYLTYVESWGQGRACVAVIDSGCAEHPFLRSKLKAGGFDYVDADLDTTNDEFGHGTGVAGVIADCTYDASVQIYPIRVLDAEGNGKMSNVINAIREAAQSGCTVMNLSLTSKQMSSALDDAVLQAVSSGIAVVVSAGNNACDTSAVAPAHLTNAGVIVVGGAEGTVGSSTRSSYSNYGESVDVYAFGSSISCCSVSGGYSSETGTSYSAPHISAACALMKLIHPGLSPSQLEARLIRASSGKGTVNVPDLGQMVPQSLGFRLSHLRMEKNTSLDLPENALPLSSGEAIAYSVSDETVAAVSGGTITALGAGEAVITASCHGIESVQFEVTVTDRERSEIQLPAGTRTIEAFAFEGNAAMTHVLLSTGVEQIGEGAFNGCQQLATVFMPSTISLIEENNTFSDAVLLCEMDSIPYAYAVEHELQYICMDP